MSSTHFRKSRSPFTKLRYEKLTPDEKEAARRFTALWEKRKREAAAQGERLTDIDLGRLLDCSGASITGYKNGRIRIDMETAIRLAKAIGVKAEEIHPQIERLSLEVKVDAQLLHELTTLVNEKLARCRFRASDRVKAEIIADLYAEAVRRELRAKDIEVVKMAEFVLRSVESWAVMR